MDLEEKTLRRRERDYRHGAVIRGYEWALEGAQFRNFLVLPCNYCGRSPANGIDRRDNAKGYTEKNSVACCKQCNTAKMAQTEAEFLAWISRIAIHKGFSL